MHPIPCAHCGHNFMRRDLNPEAEKLCNNCLYKQEQKKPKGQQTMSEIQILITCERQTQIEIEEICMNQGIDFSQYFLNLHKLNTLFEKERERLKGIENCEKFSPEMQETHEKFESLGHEQDEKPVFAEKTQKSNQKKGKR